MSSTVERHFEGTDRQIDFIRLDASQCTEPSFPAHLNGVTVQRRFDVMKGDYSVHLFDEDAVLLRDFLNRHFPEVGSNA